jgi:hypothetical protein
MFLGKTKYIFCLLVLVCFISGCGSKNLSTVVTTNSEGVPRLVAVLPVDNKTSDVQAAQILRVEILEKLYFKGYPKIPLDIIDEKLSKVYKDTGGMGGKVSPKVIGELLGVDAVMYCTLTEWKTSPIFFYAPTTVSASFELRSARTGETLWKEHHKVVKRNYGFSQKGLKMKSCQVYEMAVQEVVERVMATLPDGPDSA